MYAHVIKGKARESGEILKYIQVGNNNEKVNFHMYMWVQWDVKYILFFSFMIEL